MRKAMSLILVLSLFWTMGLPSLGWAEENGLDLSEAEISMENQENDLAEVESDPEDEELAESLPDLADSESGTSVEQYTESGLIEYFGLEDLTQGAEYDGYIVQLAEDYVSDVETLEASNLEEVLPEDNFYRVDNLTDLGALVPQVAWAEPDYIVRALESPVESLINLPPDPFDPPAPAEPEVRELPNDPYYLSSDGKQWNLTAVGFEDAWQQKLTGKEVVVGVIDTGLYAQHEDLANTKILPGYDFINNTTEMTDGKGHGTAVTSFIAASTNNGIGLASIGSGVSIVPLRALGNDGSGRNSDIIRAIAAAKDYGCKVVNMSLGGDDVSKVMKQVVGEAIADGLIIVAAVGNNGTSGISYPAGYEGVIGVAALNSNFEASYFSQYNESVDVIAPGEEVYSAWIGSSDIYDKGNGTSYSSPIVASIIAVLLETNPKLNAEEVLDILAKTSVDLGEAGWDPHYGYGLVSLCNILSLEVPVTGVSLDKTSTVVNLGESLALTATIAPANATNKKLIWSSSDPKIATVDQQGKITTLSKGATTITVSTLNGDFKAKCRVAVLNPDTEQSGTCGANLTWKLDTQGLLTINGKGAMTDYTGNSSVPWYDFRNMIKKVQIGEEVTSIGKLAFYQCEALQTIIIPEKITSIGSAAFYQCRALETVVIPNGITIIEDALFYQCDALETVVIPEGVTSIGNYAFYQGYSLKEVTIPTSVTSIGPAAFYQCRSLKEVVIPEGVTIIEDALFYQCDALETVVIPEGVTSIGQEAFYQCDALETVVIPERVTSIGQGAFYQCRSLEEVVIPEGVTSIGQETFYQCGALKTIAIPKGVTSIGNSAFAESSLKAAYFAGDVPSNFGTKVFELVDKEFIIYYQEGQAGWTSPTWQGYKTAQQGTETGSWGGLNWSLDLADYSLKITGQGAMEKAAADNPYPWAKYIALVQSLEIGEGITEIGDLAFIDCVYLEQISLPNTLAKIGQQAFDNCYSLKSLLLPESLTSIENRAFYNCASLTAITFPSGLSELGEQAFNACNNLSSAYFLGDAPTNLGRWVFSEVAEDFTVYYLADKKGWTSPTWQGNPSQVYQLEPDLKAAFSGVSLTLQSELAINFLVSKDWFAGQKAGQAGVRFNGQSDLIWDLAQDNGETYSFSYFDLAAKKMADPIQAVLYRQKADGTKQVSPALTYHLADYFAKVLPLETYDRDLKTFLVDLANYGTAAQNYFNYNTNNPLNAAVAEYQYLSSGTIEFTDADYKYSITSSGQAIKDFDLSLNLNNRTEVVLQVMDIGDYAAEDLILQVEYLDLAGQKQVCQFDGEEYEFVKETVIFNKLSAEQMDEVFWVSVKDRQGNLVSETVSYSIASYAVYVDRHSTDLALKDLTNKLVQMGRSAARYFN